MNEIRLSERSKGVSIERLNKHFGHLHVVRDMSLEVERGEFVVLLGPSGCGKTTALRMLAGLERLRRRARGRLHARHLPRGR